MKKYKVRIKSFNEIGHPKNILASVMDGDHISQISNMQNQTYTAYSWGGGWFDVYYIGERTLAIPVECLEVIEEIPSEEPNFISYKIKSRLLLNEAVTNPEMLRKNLISTNYLDSINYGTYSNIEINQLRNELLDSLGIPGKFLVFPDGES